MEAEAKASQRSGFYTLVQSMSAKEDGRRRAEMDEEERSSNAKG